MFTGLVQALGDVVAMRKVGEGLELDVDLGPVAEGARPGDSISLSGACCTVTRLAGTTATFWLSDETLRRTWFGSSALTVGRKLNLERCLRAGDPLGGHLVQGHVDGIGRVTAPVGPAGGTWQVEVPPDLLRYCVEKGSIALDGISLTVARLARENVAVAIIPHTATHTTVSRLQAGDPVNVEVDVLAKYVERLLGARDPSGRGGV